MNTITPNASTQTPFTLDEFPESAKALKHWMLWKLVPKENDKPRKVPVDIKGKKINSNAPENWMTYPEAEAAIAATPELFSGYGFQFTGSGYVGIDIDKAIDASTGEFKQAALELIERFDSYTERSPSGTGVHILVEGTKGDVTHCKMNNYEGSGIDIEIYEQGRFFTCTGDIWPGAETEIHPRQGELDGLIKQLWPRKETPAAPQQLPDEYYQAMADEDVLGILFNIKDKGSGYRALFEQGDATIVGNDDKSSADMVLANVLAFCSQKNAEQMERLMKRSALYRAKYDSARPDGEGNPSTYLRNTIAEAIRSTRDTYSPPAPQAPSGSADVVWEDELTSVYGDGYVGPREYIYGRRYAYGYMTLLIGAGGLGKTSKSDVETVSLCLGRDLFNEGEPLKCGPQRVLALSLEDDAQEFRRRHKAIAIHYGLSEEDRALVESNLVAVFRPTRLGSRVIKVLHQEGTKLIRDEHGIQRIFDLIDKHSINVLTVDPLAAVHMAEENSNGPINELATIFTYIANVKRVAVSLLHHTRKGGDGSIEDARGAGSLVAAARGGWVMGRMNSDEAIKYGIEPDKRARYVFAAEGKGNHHLLSDKKTWYYLNSVCLDNATELFDEDWLGVVSYVGHLEEEAAGGYDDAQVIVALSQISRAMPEQAKKSSQANQWIGYQVLAVLGTPIPVGKTKDLSGEHQVLKAKMVKLLSSLEAEGLVVEVETKRTSGNPSKSLRITKLGQQHLEMAHAVEAPDEYL